MASAESVKLAVEMRDHDPVRSQKLWTHAYDGLCSEGYKYPID